MTRSPFCSLYFSNLSRGTSNGAGLGAAFCVCGLAADFVELCNAGCEGAGFCPAEPAARIKNAPAASNSTRLSDAFIKVSFQMDTHRYRLTLDRARRCPEEPGHSLPCFSGSASILPHTIL